MINEAWVDLIKALEANGIFVDACSHLLREFLIYKLDMEDVFQLDYDFA